MRDEMSGETISREWWNGKKIITPKSDEMCGEKYSITSENNALSEKSNFFQSDEKSSPPHCDKKTFFGWWNEWWKKNYDTKVMK